MLMRVCVCVCVGGGGWWRGGCESNYKDILLLTNWKKRCIYLPRFTRNSPIHIYAFFNVHLKRRRSAPGRSNKMKEDIVSFHQGVDGCVHPPQAENVLLSIASSTWTDTPLPYPMLCRQASVPHP